MLFTFILNRIQPYIEKKPKNVLPTPIESYRQILQTIYSFAHEFSSHVVKLTEFYLVLNWRLFKTVF